MIFVDFSQTVIANLFVQSKGDLSSLNEDMLRHMVLNSLRSYKSKFGAKYGDLIICCDNVSWRRQAWPNYKVKRSRSKVKSEHDWNAIYGMMNKIRDEIAEVFPYKVMNVENAEADDIIAILCRAIQAPRHLIISGDHDFIQLQKYGHIDQYSSVQKKWVKMPAGMSSEVFLHQEIIRGCPGDGIPNIRSADDAFVAEDGRQMPLTKKFLKTLASGTYKDLPTDDLKKNYDRNMLLIDFDKIPVTVQQDIWTEYQIPIKGDKRRILTYLIEKKCRHLIDSLQDF